MNHLLVLWFILRNLSCKEYIYLAVLLSVSLTGILNCFLYTEAQLQMLFL